MRAQPFGEFPLSQLIIFILQFYQEKKLGWGGACHVALSIYAGHAYGILPSLILGVCFVFCFFILFEDLSHPRLWDDNGYFDDGVGDCMYVCNWL